MPESADLKPLPERPAFAGLLVRALAFLIDCVLLFFLFSGLARVARPALLALNPALPWLGYGVIYLYFWILGGPVSKGQTLGKALLNIQVAGRDGNPIGWGAAARRAVLQTVIFTIPIMVGNFLMLLGIPYLFPNHIDYTLGFPLSWWYTLSAVIAIVSLESLGLWIMLVFGVVMHPWKRGWHDLWARSFVVPAPPPPAFRYAMDIPPDVVTERKIANIPRITMIFGAILGVFFLAMVLVPSLNAKAREESQKLAEIGSRFSTPAYTLIHHNFPSVEMQKFVNGMIAYQREQAARAGQPVPTTETLRAGWLIDENTIYAEYARRHGAYSLADLSDPVLRETLTRLRAELWKQWQTEHKHALPTTSTLSTSSTSSTLSTSSTQTVQANTFSVLLFEPLALVMYNGRELKGRVRGPADPAGGPLVFEDVPKPQPQPADRTTSSSATLPAHGTSRP